MLGGGMEVKAVPCHDSSWFPPPDCWIAMMWLQLACHGHAGEPALPSGGLLYRVSCLDLLPVFHINTDRKEGGEWRPARDQLVLV